MLKDIKYNYSVIIIDLHFLHFYSLFFLFFLRVKIAVYFKNILIYDSLEYLIRIGAFNSIQFNCCIQLANISP